MKPPAPGAGWGLSVVRSAAGDKHGSRSAQFRENRLSYWWFWGLLSPSRWSIPYRNQMTRVAAVGVELIICIAATGVSSGWCC